MQHFTIVIYQGKKLWQEKSNDEIFKIVVQFASEVKNPFDIIMDEENSQTEIISQSLQELIRSCLTVDSRSRPQAKDLLLSPLFGGMEVKCSMTSDCGTFTFPMSLQCESLSDSDMIEEYTGDCLSERKINEVSFILYVSNCFS